MSNERIKEISKMYEDNLGFEQERERIKSAILLIENKNYKKAKEVLGPVIKSKTKALKMEAYALMGQIHASPKSPIYEPNIADEFLNEALKERNPRAMYLYGTYCVEGHSYLKRDVDKGLQWLELAAGKNYPDSYSELGRIYLVMLTPTAENVQKGYEYYKKGVATDDPYAYLGIGAYYYKHEKDFDKAEQNFELAISTADFKDESLVKERAKILLEKVREMKKNISKNK